jgi:hypothetical protein
MCQSDRSYPLLITLLRSIPGADFGALTLTTPAPSSAASIWFINRQFVTTFFDPLFTDPKNLPPATPMFRDINNLTYRQDFTPH